MSVHSLKAREAVGKKFYVALEAALPPIFLPLPLPLFLPLPFSISTIKGYINHLNKSGQSTCIELHFSPS